MNEFILFIESYIKILPDVLTAGLDILVNVTCFLRRKNPGMRLMLSAEISTLG